MPGTLGNGTRAPCSPPKVPVTYGAGDCPGAGAAQTQSPDVESLSVLFLPCQKHSLGPAALPSKGVIEPSESMSPFRAVVSVLVVILLLHCEPGFLRGNV